MQRDLLDNLQQNSIRGSLNSGYIESYDNVLGHSGVEEHSSIKTVQTNESRHTCSNQITDDNEYFQVINPELKKKSQSFQDRKVNLLLFIY